VQVIAPEHDPHVSVPLQTQCPIPYVDDLRVQTVDGGHWIVAERPDVIAAAVEKFLDELD